MTSDLERERQVEERLESTHAWPWYFTKIGEWYTDRSVMSTVTHTPVTVYDEPTAAFIANAPQDISYLLSALREARADAVHWSRKWSDLTGEATDLETRAETAEARVEGLRETLERIAGVRKEDVVGGIMGIAEFAHVALSGSHPKDATEEDGE